MQQVDPFIPIRPDKHSKPYRPAETVKRQAGPAGPYGMRYLRKPDITPVKAPARNPTLKSAPMPTHPAAANTRTRPPMPEKTLQTFDPPHHANPPIIDAVVRTPQPAKHPPIAASPAAVAATPFPPVPPHQAARSSRLHSRRKAREKRQPAAHKHRSVQLVQIGLIIGGAIVLGVMIESLAFGELVIAAYAIFALVKHVASRNTFILALITLAGIVVLLLVQGGDSDASDNFAVYTFLLLVVGTISLGLEVRHETA